MADDLHIERHENPDEPTRLELLELLERVTRTQGHRPLGEHKYTQLEAGAGDWSGVVARGPGGDVAGYAHVRWSAPGREPRGAVELVLDPATDVLDPATDSADLATGHGEATARLLAEVEAMVARRGGGLLWMWAHRVDDPGATPAVRLGFRVQRDLAFMRRPLASRPDPGTPPTGVTLRPYRGEVDDEEFLRVNNRAFEGHPENGGWSREDFAARRSLPWFDPDGLLMAWRDERLAGFHWTKRHGQDSGEAPADEPVGEVYVLAVDRDAQGSGLGRHLLDAGLAHLHDRGCRLAVLYVDRASAGAVRLYERAGFEIASHEVCYERPVEA